MEAVSSICGLTGEGSSNSEKNCSIKHARRCDKHNCRQQRKVGQDRMENMVQEQFLICKPCYNVRGFLGKAVRRFSPCEADTVAEAARNNDEEVQGTAGRELDASGECLTVPAQVVFGDRNSTAETAAWSLLGKCNCPHKTHRKMDSDICDTVAYNWSETRKQKPPQTQRNQNRW